MKNKVTIGFTVMLLALLSVGAAYGHWFEILYVDGYVEAGEVDVWFKKVECNDVGLDPGLKNIVFEDYGNYLSTEPEDYWDRYSLTGDYGLYDKDVAWQKIWIDDNYEPDYNSPPPPNGEERNKVWLEFYNVYPSYAPMSSIWVKNKGTIPVHPDGFWLYYDGPIPYPVTDDPGKLLDLAGLELIGWAITMNDVTVECGTKGTYDGLPDVFVEPMENLGLNTLNTFVGTLYQQQLHPGDELDFHLLWHFQQEMVENTSFRFHIKVRFTQWNLAGQWPEEV
jgi:hypothetical protein